ncbi:hypothetical protein [Sphingomonas corticis]|uniref:DUF2946 domain-containing protein n=1 Tax=Sphingomonas corticis TaxID=2722791 RepID=A0ABX1CS99_9SPHN|nr:hypothetical protein [Sphingomonas corticis]NJR80796.1 hypothetical protein [Sphingomonas corticis]
MKGRLSFFLLLAALLGFLGQQAAYAGGPALVPLMEASHAMTLGMDCPEMEKPRAMHDAPCKGLTLACIAQMGCVIPVTVQDRLGLAIPRASVPLAAYQAMIRPLAGRDVAPEPEPPTV